MWRRSGLIKQELLHSTDYYTQVLGKQAFELFSLNMKEKVSQVKVKFPQNVNALIKVINR